VANARGGGWVKDKCSNFCGGNESNAMIVPGL